MNPEASSTTFRSLEYAVTRWINTAQTRRARSVLIGVGIMLLAQIAGLRIDWRAYLAMAVWLAANYVMAPWAVRPADFSQRRRRYAVTIVVDVLVLSVLYLSLDAVQWLGIGLFVNSALVASATLPRRWVYGITALIVAVYGTLAWFAVSGVLAMPSPFGLAPVRGNTGFLVGQILSSATVLLLMVTLQEHLVRTIRDAEQRFLALVQAVPDMVMTFDSRGNFVYVNPATLEQSGYNRDELTRIPDARFFPQEELPKVQDALERTIAGETTSLELRYLRKSGESRWIQAKAVPFGLHGESEALLVIARDVTDARKRTDEVYANEARIRAIVDSLNVGFATLDTEGRVTSIFGAFAEGVQMAGASLSGVTVRELRVGGEPLPAALLAQIEGSVELALRGESINTHWRNVPTSSQPVRHLRAHLAPLRDAQREIVGVAAVWSDETADVMAEQERDVLRTRLAHAERIEALAKLVSGVAHELNNPLAAVLNFTEDLLGSARSDDERASLAVIQSQALRSRTIVRDLLSFVRKGEGRPRTREQPGALLETIILAARPGFAALGISFDAAVSDTDTVLIVDRSGFEQVVTNLLTNAGQAAGVGGAVRLAARRSGEWFEVAVEDNGAGIAQEHFGRIFEPFFTTKPTGQGVGLGLSVSLGIVQGHGGELIASNRGAASGGGARFEMRLPVAASLPEVMPADAARDGTTHAESVPGDLARGEPTTAPRSRLRQTTGSLAPMPPRRASLLVIDDEESIRRVLRRYFERRGWAVDEAPDGTDALVKLLRPDAPVLYDVVLCDLKMPGVPGPELYRRLQVDAPEMVRRLILSSGDVSAPDIADFLATVSSPVLEKPFELTSLLVIAEQVRRSASEGR